MLKMKLLVFSDSHGSLTPMARSVRMEAPEGVIHLGDYVRDFTLLRKEFPGLSMWNVPGNCDGTTSLPEQLVLELEGHRLFLTHGHRYQVKQTCLRAIYAAREARAEVLLFGHTHRQVCFQEQALWVMNPGAAGQSCCGILELSRKSVRCRLINEAKGR